MWLLTNNIIVKLQAWFLHLDNIVGHIEEWKQFYLKVL